jgi:hypothetical protein
MKEILREW